jgi:HlyD family secretion protein
MVQAIKQRRSDNGLRAESFENYESGNKPKLWMKRKEDTMKRFFGIGLLGLALAAGIYTAFEFGLLAQWGVVAAAPAAAVAETNEVVLPAVQQQDEAQTGAAVAQTATSRRVADARVVPVLRSDLAMAASGLVKQVFVEEGELVEAGTVLVKLDDAQAMVSVAQAQASLLRAQAQLAQLEAGARSQEIAVAEAGLKAAQANYDRLINAGAPGELAKVLEGPSGGALIAAEADVRQAEAELRNAQSAYNEVKWRSDVGMLPQSLRLEQASVAFEAAQARYDDLNTGATPADIAGASALVRQGQARLTQLQNAAPTDVLAAEANVEQFQAQLDLLLAGAQPESIAIAEADVAAATAALQQALVALGNTELRAPFTGVVATLNVAVGEQVASAAAVVQLADVTAWEIETEDLTEFDAVGVTAGDKVLITFDALPDVVMDGEVVRVRPLGEDNRGDIVYKVVVSPDSQDERLLWNMTAVVEFVE